ncbi:hypothetical protein BKA70DRAFT_1039275, partial [Coprinopsis sp. MPI-PUGE-AT-0042]
NIRILSLGNDGEGEPIALRSLWKLMALDNLESLTVLAECKIESLQEDRPDQLFHHLCLSAKHKEKPLTKLHFGKLSGEPLTLTALHHVCDHLPHLLDLRLSFNSSLAYAPAQRMLTPVSIVANRTSQRHPLQKLCLRDLRSTAFKPKEYREIAPFVNQLFPELDALHSAGPASEEGTFIEEGWELIHGLRHDYK